MTDDKCDTCGKFANPIWRLSDDGWTIEKHCVGCMNGSQKSENVKEKSLGGIRKR